MIRNVLETIRKNKYVYFIIFMILLLCTSIFMENRYASDTYFLESSGYLKNASIYFNDGRIFMGLFLHAMQFLHISYATCKMISWILAFISIFASIILFYTILNKYHQNQVLKVLLSIGVILNPFTVELFMFPEYTGIICLGIFFGTLVVYFLHQYMEYKNKKHFLLALLFSFLTTFTYQGIFSVMVILSVIFTMKYAKNGKEFFINQVWIGMMYGITTVSSFLTTSFLGSGRIQDRLPLGEAFHDLIEGVQRLLITTFSVLPSYVYLILFLLVLFTVIVCFYLEKKKAHTYLFLVYTIVAIFFVALIPHLFVSYIWLTPRSCVGLGLLVVVPALVYFLYGRQNKGGQIILSIFLIVLLGMQYRGFVKLGTSQIKNNVFENMDATFISREIEKYEKDHLPITKFKMYLDQNPTMNSPGVLMDGDMNYRVFISDWAALFATSFKTGKDLEEGLENEKNKEYCMTHNWDVFSPDQLRYEEDTLYICSY